MVARRSRIGVALPAAAAALHALLLAAVAVPGYAVADALRALFDPAAARALTGLAEWQRWVALLRNTAVVAGVAVLTSVALGTGLALLATRTNLPGRRGLRSDGLQL